VAYRAALDRLSELGLRRVPGETRERFAERLEPRAPSLAPLTREHVGRAFGAHRLVPPAEMRRLASQAVAETVRGAPWWRVALGWIDPLSWLFTR
jgi:hypothetical protein